MFVSPVHTRTGYLGARSAECTLSNNVKTRVGFYVRVISFTQLCKGKLQGSLSFTCVLLEFPITMHVK